ncbi:hypothetical protein [Sphingobium nicotianae]|uniref:Uncharacterized protein n=1 Tax=Sphingobium nicotianae TaxID=2782607 RepID=A0A9X1IRP9_9SPHN|nr:hypothetical protein [Sphingobium nicotianae]MBT2187572.1 hypothetical protein [Sphingobium nicotianae]
MAARIPDSRLGRALKAGIPVALILLGTELLEGTFKVERTETGLALSWSSPVDGEEARDPAVRLLSCAHGTCRRWTFPLTVPAPHLVSTGVSLVGSLADFISSDCSEQRRARGRLATA